MYQDLQPNDRPIYTTNVLGTAPLKMGTRAQNFEHGTSVFCRVNATKIGNGAEKVEGAETFSRGSLGTSRKRCRAQILKKSKICLPSRTRKIIYPFPKWRQATKIYNLPKGNKNVQNLRSYNGKSFIYF